MAGGQGTRFWPYSTPEMPKQFLNIVGDEALIKQTYDRLSNFLSGDDIYIVADEKYRELTIKSVPDFKDENYIAEPSPKNTAPCLILANIVLSKNRDENSNVIVVPADHYIPDNAIFSKEMKNALLMADQKFIITSGVKPDSPHTGYGYIKFNPDRSSNMNGTVFYDVDEFEEKPSQKVAKQYIKAGNYFWNSGMFIYKLKHFKEFLKIYALDYYREYENLEKNYGNPDKFIAVYNGIKQDSIDYVLMEKVKEVKMFGAGFEWNDVGSWSSVSQLNKKDKNGNVDIGNNVIVNSENSMIYSNLEKPVALIGLDNVVVINTKTGILVSRTDELQSVKEVVNVFKQREKENR